MRDIYLYFHIIFGIVIIFLSIVILLQSRKKSDLYLIKPLSIITAITGWLLLIPSAILYIVFYPATKTLVKAGAWPWAHSILMETKEHWGLLIPILTTVAASLVVSGKIRESRKWWILIIIIAVLMAVMGRVIKIGAVL